ncbi:demethylmenaquinone methyltransferase [Buchananella felis]|uniref:demethylmenaquinone methyltransferase n=1 Tax=Buchananella felis TaxID=3231492 RepID=UPI0035276A6B
MRADLDKDPNAIAGMFDRVARRYDLTNDVLSLWCDRAWRRATRRALGAQPGMRILDLGAGTGTSAAGYYEDGADVVACDLSEGMIAEGRRRYPFLEFVQGDATDLPFEDNSFDASTISFALRNVQGTEKALRELLRVTKPGGHVVICEFSTPSTRLVRGPYNFYLGTVLPAISRMVSSNGRAYEYLAESILAWPNQAELADMMRGCGWENVGHRNLSAGIVALHRGFKPAN